MDNWCVYMHEHRESGKKYIGITGQKPEKRWKNGLGYARQPVFYAAIMKYGWDAFRHEVLYTELTQAEAERLEVELIAKYQTLSRVYGYNLDPGGGGVLTPTEETRRKMRESQLGRVVSDDARRKMSAARKGLSPWNKGRPTLLAVREKLSLAKVGNTNAKQTRVICEETQVVYPSMTAAERATGVNHSKISMCCAGKRNTAGGYCWRYYTEDVQDHPAPVSI